MQTTSVKIEVLGNSDAERGQRAAELEQLLKTTVPGVSVKRTKINDETMELGTVLTVVFGSAAIEALGKGIAHWLAKRQSAQISIMTDKGQVNATGLTSADAVRIADILSQSADGRT